ncbi:nicotinamidase-related amidase [Antricoccus suffuscus]|uniref:Nicotinamidase-related amidase n=1 Tax=Antricoccus suffuscus TaxID=1629062 RepID=A0A2T1A2P7_9ACTN|nr:isochorismatase family protein [Antricoccus suffuscus]PRZ42814.1 nicotinamidase-related amidase [Antricoccus suffuscus]
MTEPADQFGAGFAGRLQPGARPAVIAVDLMAAYFDPSSPFDVGSRSCLQSAARVIAAARASGVPVLHTRVVFGPDGIDGGVFLKKVPALRALIGGGPMSALMPEVAPAEDEVVLIKQYASAFFGTSLASTLHSLRVDTAVVLGVSTSGCVRATALDALQNGLIPLVVRDAVGDRDAPAHDAALHDLQAKYAEVVTESDVIDYLSGLTV